MALKATIFKADLQISNMDKHYYHDHALTVARHPSENDERMMVRVLAFALYAHEALAFGKGLSTDDEPDLWQKDLTGAIELWIDVGLPDEKRIRKACGRAAQVVVLSYGGRGAELWWGQVEAQLERFKNLTVINLPQLASQALAGLVKLSQRTMQLQCLVQEGHAWLSSGDDRIEIVPVLLKAAVSGR
ncbi:MAG: YaeQ family protein [Sterolibacterium sp.]